MDSPVRDPAFITIVPHCLVANKQPIYDQLATPRASTPNYNLGVIRRINASNTRWRHTSTKLVNNIASGYRQGNHNRRIATTCRDFGSSPLLKGCENMSRLITYLMEGDEADRKSISMVFGEVSGGIRALDEMAESYGVHFSESVIDQLYKELDAHIEKMGQEQSQ